MRCAGEADLCCKLSILTTAEHRKQTATGSEDGLPHGTAVLKKLVPPLAGSRRVVCADSYFASVAAAQQLLGMGLRFIGVVKTATRGFPMGSLSAIPLEARGQHVSYSHSTADGAPDLMAVVWVDLKCRYFIASTSSTLEETPNNRLRWRQGDVTASRVALTVPQPLVAETYFGCCAQIDQHNRCRQDDLRLEQKLVTQDWSMRFNLFLLGICVVDAWLLYSGARGGGGHLTQSDFYEDLAEQLIDNTFETAGLRARPAPSGAAAAADAAPLRSGVGIHLTATVKHREGPASKEGDHRAQRACHVCKRRGTSWVCSGCRKSTHRGVYCCGPRTGRRCFETHAREVHELDM